MAGDWDDLHPVPGDGTDWPEFFLERRLRFQVRLAERNGHGNALAHLLDRAEPVILGLLETARHEGWHVKTVDLRNSGDTAGDRSRVVGYGAYVLY